MYIHRNLKNELLPKLSLRLRMEYLEILLTDFKKQYVDSIVKQELKITTDLVDSSHFYNEVENKNMEYYNGIDLKRYFSTPNTANIFKRISTR